MSPQCSTLLFQKTLCKNSHLLAQAVAMHIINAKRQARQESGRDPPSLARRGPMPCRSCVLLGLWHALAPGTIQPLHAPCATPTLITSHVGSPANICMQEKL